MKPVQNPPFILAVVIGINKYTGSADYTDLTGAVDDANSVEHFLTSRLQVPKKNICSLRDEQASRDGIMRAFFFLRDTDIAPRTDCEIIIYYAGHGAQEDTPEEWKDWYTPTGRIEMLCPSDIGARKTFAKNGVCVDEVVPGIPDRTISALLNQISERKGNHITVILDCCSSAGMNRGVKEPMLIPRQIYNAPPINSAIDKAYLKMDKAGKQKIPVEHSRRFRASHVLLAACGQEQLAWEDPATKRGLFTDHLLKILAGDDLETLTYRSLMDSLSMPKKQTPHCEGEGLNQLLFGNRENGGDTSFIYGRRVKDSPPTIQAGSAEGITPGSRFSVHKNSMKDTTFRPNPCLGYLTAVTVSAFSTTLVPSQKLRLPPRFYCKLVDSPSQTISLYSTHRTWLLSTFPSEDWHTKSVKIVDDPAKCDFELVIEDGMVYLERHNDPVVIEHIKSRNTRGIPVDEIDTLHNVVKAACHFAYHLTRSAPDNADNVRMEMYKLEPDNSDGLYNTVFKPVDDNLFDKDPTTIEVDDEQDFGITIINDSDDVLYAYLYYFDPNDFTITEHYAPPLGAGSGRLTTMTEIGLDAALPAHSRLGVGHGNSGSQPMRFSIPEGQKEDIGFFRLFLSTTPGNFQSIAQLSPFERRRGALPGQAESPAAERWMAMTATVIQKPRGAILVDRTVDGL
ncbi:hypothetical protein HYPSUDRAFT_195003 [Hypholoma sublateritium FD-334 SS-4]|uniref:Peptidase C14 caspase domain-containing protein n=1 Tax=Hypholoma sublateritium (strain FD-334 SS-4) TaxID=945553 RepID=A0A0D2N5W5_HYPSF|nr:hypothetical protein HYPSUDRAFT_195003 [Hypholoma sublateritium FD-334 SS-4]